MATHEKLELVSALEEIIMHTLNGKITWNCINPTTFAWITMWTQRKGIRSTIQKVVTKDQIAQNGVVRIRTVENFIFQVTDVRSDTQMITASTKTTPHLGNLLKRLYEASSVNISSKGLCFLKKALESLSEGNEYPEP